MTAPRPICGHCGKPYGKRLTSTEKVQWREGEAKPEYKGNAILLKENYHGVSLSREGFLKLRMRMSPTTSKWVEQEALSYPEHPAHTAYRTLWDGVTYFGGYKPFCTLRCALEYARKAYAKSHRRSLE